MKEDTNLREHGLARGQTNHNYIRGVRIWAPRQALSREEEKKKKKAGRFLIILIKDPRSVVVAREPS